MARPSGSAKAPVAHVAPTPPPSSVSSKSKSKSKAPKRKEDYTSEGVEDNDVFLLPISDYQVMIGLTLLAAAVRLFRIY